MNITEIRFFQRLHHFGRKKKRGVYYITEQADWVIKQIGISLLKYLAQNHQTTVQIATDFANIQKSIIHFGSRHIYLPENYKHVDSSNHIIFTWFHGTDQDTDLICALPKGSQKAQFIHTACTISKHQLIEWGADAEKIVIIPLGVDLDVFKSASLSEKYSIRKELGIPEKAIVIGSFQKDGNGWGEGLEPKLIKGPDIFCAAVEQLHKNYPLFVVLTGPARGYVKQRLVQAKIPFQHVYLHNYYDVAKYFQALDLYLITSRTEGGPKAVLESMASGVPLVSTRVGMANDVIQHGMNGFLAEIEDVHAIVAFAEKVINNTEIQTQLRENGLETAKNFDWKLIAAQYYEKLYANLLIR